MPYTEADFERMKSDPDLARQYVWQVGQRALRRAVRLRAKGRLSEAQTDARFGRLVLDHIDLIAAPEQRGDD